MKRLLILLFAASCLTAVGQVPDYVPTDGLNAWYDFNTNLIDASGNSNEAENHGATFGPDRWGNELFAIDFTGAGQWVETSQWLTGIRNNFTISIWFNLRSFESQNGPGATIFLHRAHWKDKALMTGTNSDTGQSLGDSILYADRQFVGTNFLKLFSQPIELNVWNHVVISGDNSSFFLFANGELIDQSPRTFDSDWSGAFYGAYLGGNGYESSSTSTMNGMVDEFGAWSRALSVSEIQGLFAAGEPVFGCMDEEACNFDTNAIVSDGSCTYPGCLDNQACNFDQSAFCDDGSCDYSCCPGPGCCSIGLYWDWEVGKCFDINPADINLDGCVQLNDLLDLLSAYGDCGAEETSWQCGDPLDYQGYDYETVQIGEQCWFAENLRAEKYRNGDIIPDGFSAGQWSTLSEGARAVYGNNDANLPDFGYMFNWRSTIDERGLCPSGWHVPSHQDHLDLVSALNQINEGCTLVTEEGGLGMKYGGYRKRDGSFTNLNVAGYYWSTSLETDGKSWGFAVYPTQCTDAPTLTDEMFTWGHWIEEGFSIRCIKNTE